MVSLSFKYSTFNWRLDCEFPICVFSYLYGNKSE